MQFDRGYLSPYFVTNADKMTSELEDCMILLHEKKLSSLQSMVPLLESVIQSQKPLLIIAEDVEGVVGSVMAVETLKILSQSGETLLGQMFIYDGLRGESRKIKLKPIKKCPVCSS